MSMRDLKNIIQYNLVKTLKINIGGYIIMYLIFLLPNFQIVL